jgi:hypothetical protein
MFIFLGAVYGIIMVIIAVWAVTLIRSNYHFRTKIQHPSLAHLIRW